MMILLLRLVADQQQRKDRLSSSQYHGLVLTVYDTLFDIVAHNTSERVKVEEVQIIIRQLSHSETKLEIHILYDLFIR